MGLAEYKCKGPYGADFGTKSLGEEKVFDLDISIIIFCNEQERAKAGILE